MYTKEQAQEHKEVYDKWLVSSGQFTFDDYIDENTEKTKPVIKRVSTYDLDTGESFITIPVKEYIDLTRRKQKPELKPCPFCGMQADIAEREGKYMIYCIAAGSCSARTSWNRTKESVITKWNKRE